MYIQDKAITSPYYLSTNFQRLNENETRIIRATANNFFKPRICNNTFAYSAISDWNDLPSNIKDIKGEKNFKDSLKKCILEEAENKEKIYLFKSRIYTNTFSYSAICE